MAHNENSGFATWFIFGALVGAAAGILLAPKSGKDTREMIGDQARNWRDKANYQAGGIRERASQQAGRFRERMNDQETGRQY
jgi:gas vesicle protein